MNLLSRRFFAACAVLVIIRAGLFGRACLVAILMAPLVSVAAALPNILFIVSDDQGWRDIGYRNPAISTPNLDRLAAGGVRLEHHYVFPTCSPTRCALMCGRNPARFGILGPIDGRSTLKMPADIPNLASMLKSRGYFTAISGKWHLSLQIENGPRHYGFDSTYGYLHGQIDPWVHDYKTGDRTWHRNDQFTDDTGHATDLIAAEAVRLIEQKRNQPFFVYVAFSVPHTPLSEDSKWTAPYQERFKEETRQLVGASITHMDDGIGRIVAAVDRSGSRENTLIIFTSDNGGPQRVSASKQYAGRYQQQSGPLSDNGLLRGWKTDTYEGGVLVPAFVNWPARLKPRTETAVVSALDWLPTLAALTGFETSERMKLDGMNIWPILTGASTGRARTLFWKTREQSAVRIGDWKLVSGRNREPELFNLSDDPYEKIDLAAKKAEWLAEMKSKLGAGLAEQGDNKLK